MRLPHLASSYSSLPSCVLFTFRYYQLFNTAGCLSPQGFFAYGNNLVSILKSAEHTPVVVLTSTSHRSLSVLPFRLTGSGALLTRSPEVQCCHLTRCVIVIICWLPASQAKADWSLDTLHFGGAQMLAFTAHGFAGSAPHCRTPRWEIC